jgi:hypothetical protein
MAGQDITPKTLVSPVGANARSLDVLVSLIRKEIMQADAAARQASAPHWSRIGELLLEAKTHFEHTNEFYDWSKRNFGIGKDQTIKRVAVAVAAETKSRIRNASSLNAALKEMGHSGYRPSGTPKRPWHGDVQSNIDRAKREAKHFLEDARTRQQEREAEKKLAERLIDIGFKVLAKELHPDKGGSRETMARLNLVRKRLMKCA